MLRSFHLICQIHLKHLFYRRKVTNDIEFIPSASTRGIMSRLDLKLRRGQDGLTELYYGTSDNAEPSLLAALQGQPLKLVFFLRLTRSDFFLFTDIPFVDLTQQRFFFSNWKAPIGSKALYFNGLPAAKEQDPVPPEFVGDGDLLGRALPPLQPLLAAYPPPEEPADEEDNPHWAGLEDETGQSVAQWPLLWDAEEEKWEIGPIDLSQVGAGKYRMRIGEQRGPFFLVGEPGMLEAEFGLLELWLHGNELGERPFLSDGEPPALRPVEYELSFQNRSTVWRYHLIARKREGEAEPPSYQYKLEGETFVEEIREDPPLPLRPDEKGVSFRSTRSLQLKEPGEGEARISLQLFDPDSVEQPPAITLPAPQVDNVKAVRRDGEVHWYSEMYIYL